MRMEDPLPTFTYLVQQLASNHSNLAYLHLIEPRIAGDKTFELDAKADESNHLLREIWQPRPLIVAGGFTPETARSIVEQNDGAVAMGRSFIANVG